MTENAKTITFVVIGLVAIMIGLVTRPSTADLDFDAFLGENLTKQFGTAEEAKRLRIVRFEEDTATLREFEVAEEDGLWTIPSKDGYPADAVRQMAEAANALIDRQILAVASRSAGDHVEYGVIDPLSPRLEPGQTGVGTRVTMTDVHGAALADLIVGKRVRDAEGQRYVREAGRDLVYVIELDLSRLSTNFEDWIEKDLLKLRTWDLQQVEIKDYSAELVPVMRDGRFGFEVSWDPRAEMTLAYDDSQGEWSAVELRRFDPTLGDADYVEFHLADDEELDQKVLTDMKNALDDLKIVDVVRKPAGLSRDLKAGEDFLNNEEALRDLASRGFTALGSSQGGPVEIISSDGEVIATMKDGTEYVLRFGDLTNVGSGEQTGAEPAGAEAAAAGANNDGDVNRYLFVMARFNDAAVQPPELQPLPDLPAKTDEPAAEEDAAVDAAEQATAEPADAAAEEVLDGEAPNSEEPNGEADARVEPENAAANSASSENEAANSENEAAEAPPADDAAEEPANTDEPANAETSETDAAEEDSELEKIIAERKRIEQENQRKLDEFNDTLKKGRENVQELNLRFGDWYFVVNDDVFRKIRLSRDDVIQKKEPPADEDEDAEGDEAGFNFPGGLPDIPGVRQ